MTYIDHFLEKMDHEIPDIDINLDGKGYKVDGDKGIKKFCELHRQKSVDYFHERNNSILYIEFSDIWRQHVGCIACIKEIKDSNLSKSTKRKMVKDEDAKIRHEFIAKFKDSYTINSNLNDCFDNLPEFFDTETKKQFVIVVAPFEEDNITDLVKFYDILRSKILSSIPEKMLLKIAILPLDEFSKQL